MESEPNLVPYLIILLLLLFASVFALFVYSGLFTKIIIRAGPPSFGSVRIAYKFARGPYKNAGQLFTEAHCLAPDFQTIGIYYDDPQQVNPADLRYCVGVMLPEDRPDASENLKTLLENGFKEMVLPAVDHAVLTSFPFNNTISIFIGVARVYPKLAEYIQEKKLCAHPMIEIYTEKEIVFMAPLSRQDEFYVEETNSPEGGSHPEDSESQEGEEFEGRGSDQDIQNSNDENPTVNGPVEENDDSSGSSFEELQH